MYLFENVFHIKTQHQSVLPIPEKNHEIISVKIAKLTLKGVLNKLNVTAISLSPNTLKLQLRVLKNDIEISKGLFPPITSPHPLVVALH